MFSFFVKRSLHWLIQWCEFEGGTTCLSSQWLTGSGTLLHVNAISYGDSGGTELTSLKLRARCVISNAVGKHKP